MELRIYTLIYEMEIFSVWTLLITFESYFTTQSSSMATCASIHIFIFLWRSLKNTRGENMIITELLSALPASCHSTRMTEGISRNSALTKSWKISSWLDWYGMRLPANLCNFTCCHDSTAANVSSNGTTNDVTNVLLDPSWRKINLRRWNRNTEPIRRSTGDHLIWFQNHGECHRRDKVIFFWQWKKNF